jgi:hypothetical protein
MIRGASAVGDQCWQRSSEEPQPQGGTLEVGKGCDGTARLSRRLAIGYVLPYLG